MTIIQKTLQKDKGAEVFSGNKVITFCVIQNASEDMKYVDRKIEEYLKVAGDVFDVLEVKHATKDIMFIAVVSMTFKRASLI